MCPDEPQKPLTDLAQWLKAPLPASTPKIPLIPTEKARKQTQDLVPNFLDTRLPFYLFYPPESEILSIQLIINSISRSVSIAGRLQLRAKGYRYWRLWSLNPVKTNRVKASLKTSTSPGW